MPKFNQVIPIFAEKGTIYRGSAFHLSYNISNRQKGVANHPFFHIPKT